MHVALRTVPLYDPAARPPTWNERMKPGEIAVHFSAGMGEIDAATCAIFTSLSDAEGYAQEAVLQHPTLQCSIFDHHGFVGAPLRVIAGSEFKSRGEITPRFRRWVGSILFFGGSALFITDWVANFRFDWPSVLGSRLMMPGLILLVMEALITLHQRRAQRNTITAQP